MFTQGSSAKCKVGYIVAIIIINNNNSNNNNNLLISYSLYDSLLVCFVYCLSLYWFSWLLYWGELPCKNKFSYGNNNISANFIIFLNKSEEVGR